MKPFLSTVLITIFLIIGLKSFLSKSGLAAPAIILEAFYTLMIVLAYVFQSRKWKMKYNGQFKLLLLLLFFEVVSVLRLVLSPGNFNIVYFGDLLFITIILIILIKTILEVKPETSFIVNSLIIGLLLVVAVNLIATHLFNVKSPEEKEFVKAMESGIGFTSFRVYYPFCESTRHLSQVTGLLIILIFMNSLIGPGSLYKTILLGLPSLFLGLLLIMIMDSRLVFILIIFSVILYIFFLTIVPRKYLKSSYLIVVVLLSTFPLTYLLVLFVFPDLLELPYDMGLNGRLFIWGTILSEKFIFNFNILENLFGNGFFGHKISGLSVIYGKIFEGAWLDTDRITSHSAFLQRLIDQGIFGVLFFYLSLLYISNKYIINQYLRTRSHENVLYFGLLFILGVGMTEVVLSFYNLSFLIIIFVFITSIITCKPSKKLIASIVK